MREKREKNVGDKTEGSWDATEKTEREGGGVETNTRKSQRHGVPIAKSTSPSKEAVVQTCKQSALQHVVRVQYNPSTVADWLSLKILVIGTITTQSLATK